MIDRSSKTGVNPAAAGFLVCANRRLQHRTVLAAIVAQGRRRSTIERRNPDPRPGFPAMEPDRTRARSFSLARVQFFNAAFPARRRGFSDPRALCQVGQTRSTLAADLPAGDQIRPLSGPSHPSAREDPLRSGPFTSPRMWLELQPSPIHRNAQEVPAIASCALLAAEPLLAMALCGVFSTAGASPNRT